MRPEPSEVVVDARWLGHTGVGRVTDMLMTGLAELRPGPWTVWGPAAAERYVWLGARFVLEEASPLSRGAQAAIGRVPPGLLVSPHAVRPLTVWRPSVVLAHDLIPAHHGPMLRRLLWRAFFKCSLRTATRVVVYSDATEQAVAPVVRKERLRHIRLTSDPGFGAAVRHAREESSGSDWLLYVGMLKRHKNLDRAIDGFARSQFARRGGQFVLVAASGTDFDVPRLAERAGIADQVVLLRRQTEEELVGWYAGAAAVIQPSLEEGLGLTSSEALLGEIPVACSSILAQREATAGFAAFFDPRDPQAIADAIDLAVAQGPDARWLTEARYWRAMYAPLTPAEFAAQLVAVVEELKRSTASARGRPSPTPWSRRRL